MGGARGRGVEQNLPRAQSRAAVPAWTCAGNVVVQGAHGWRPTNSYKKGRERVNVRQRVGGGVARWAMGRCGLSALVKRR